MTISKLQRGLPPIETIARCDQCNQLGHVSSSEYPCPAVAAMEAWAKLYGVRRYPSQPAGNPSCPKCGSQDPCDCDKEES